MKIAFAGLGAMGRGMAARLIGAGHELSGHDPAPGAADWLAGQGARAEASAF